MPYIDVKLTKKLTSEEEIALKSELGKNIALFAGKTESWLMCSISSGEKIWFRGDNSEASAFIEVKLFGNVDKSSANSFTRNICSYLQTTFDVDPQRVYIRYVGGNDWGWNGANF